MPIQFNHNKKWGQFGKRLSSLQKARDYLGLAEAYYEAATFLESRGQIADDLERLGHAMLLKSHKRQLNILRRFNPRLRLKIVAKEEACDACEYRNGRIVSLQKALLHNWLPVPDCHRKRGCRCIYVPQLEDGNRDEWMEAVQL